jgi:hypothetical protein
MHKIELISYIKVGQSPNRELQSLLARSQLKGEMPCLELSNQQ